jgi:hypothetical protein
MTTDEFLTRRYAGASVSSGDLRGRLGAGTVAEARLREASGETRRIPHDEVRRRLGLDG